MPWPWDHLVAEATRLRPDVIVADISMPELSGLDAMRQLKAKRSDAKVHLPDDARRRAHRDREAVRAGASGYVLKHSAGEELVTAIEQVLQGHTDPDATRSSVTSWRAWLGPTAVVELTARQREVLRLIVEGRRMKEIATILNLSPRTVETHKYELTRALGLRSTAELVRYAIEHKLVVP